ncbi:uncharacterized protein SPSK_05589 [Sporothrix schenckii 1099-18]|uniref:Uncharacterized protein n=1 Tax=Sporothrix schenckii 1099-18 TaxID=1397361 RepID=A0A0F2LSF6_SPOSC|nr:uncharacterized protein SPSK_05589 [Sporothrix schenckii 1099-18]KJR80422.1 hypothetical protein SPSK_05589 [Sporothrix schenckii 1099-18]
MVFSRSSRRNPVAQLASSAKGCLSNVNEAINRSTFGRIFRLRGSGHPEEIRHANFATEIRAGLTTFATMAYIVAVNVRFLYYYFENALQTTYLTMTYKRPRFLLQQTVHVSVKTRTRTEPAQTPSSKSASTGFCDGNRHRLWARFDDLWISH